MRFAALGIYTAVRRRQTEYEALTAKVHPLTAKVHPAASNRCCNPADVCSHDKPRRPRQAFSGRPERNLPVTLGLNYKTEVRFNLRYSRRQYRKAYPPHLFPAQYPAV